MLCHTMALCVLMIALLLLVKILEIDIATSRCNVVCALGLRGAVGRWAGGHEK